MTTNNAINSANPIGVASGGTGNATQAAYSLVAGGTTTTGAFQAVGPNSSSNAILYSQGSSSLPAFSTSGTPYVSGISFDSGSNTLSAYSSGTFTPTIQFGGSSTGITYTYNIGKYIIIGKLLFFTINILTSSKGSASGGCSVAGLPFASVNDSFRYNFAIETNPTFSGGLGTTFAGAELFGNQTTINITQCGGGNQESLSNTNYGNVITMFINGCYWIP